MRWTSPFRYPNIRNTIDKYHLYDRTLMMLRTKMAGSGSPCTYWRNSALSFYGTLDETATKCYCWKITDDNEISKTIGQPRRDHALCMGTGVLKGYQKFGYKEIVVSTPSTVTFSSSAITIGRDASGEPDRFMISSATSIDEYVETENFTLTNFKSVDRFLTNESTKADSNRIEYYYSLDNGVSWIQLTMDIYATNEIANRQATNFVLSTGIQTIKFRMRLRKRNQSSPSPALNSIRFRYKKHINLNEMDPRFDISMPSFLASREAPRLEISHGEHGWKTIQPVRWWTLPEIDIRQSDIIMFLQGEFADQKYEVQNMTKHTYGPELQVLHRSFESAFLRDKYDLIRILHLLT